MGGLIRTPKIRTPGPAPTVTTVPSAQQAADTAAAAAHAAGIDARQAALLRSRRGRAGTIATSSRGVLGAPVLTTTRKSLLGE